MRLALCALLAACVPPARPTAETLRWVLDPGSGYFVTAAAPSGDVFVVGETHGPTDLHATGIWIEMHRRDDGAVVWRHEIPGPSMPHIATDGDGNLIITGSYYGTVDFGGIVLTSAGSAFAIELDPNSQLLWANDVGANAGACGLAAGAAPDGTAYATGFCHGALSVGATQVDCQGNFIAAFASDGTPLWAATFANGTDATIYPAVFGSPDGSVVLTGGVAGEATFGTVKISQSRSTFAARYSRVGDLIRADLISSTLAATALDAAGNLIVADGRLSSWTADGKRQWQEPAPELLLSSSEPSLAVTASNSILGIAPHTLQLFASDGAFVDAPGLPLTGVWGIKRTDHGVELIGLTSAYRFIALVEGID